MAWESLREFLEAIDKEGQLKTIEARVDWDQEIGGIARAVLDSKSENKALLFSNIKDHQVGPFTRFLTLTLGNYQRIATMLGLPAETTAREMIKIVRQRLRETQPPILVSSGPVKENILLGNKLNLFQLPVPRWNARDGGRYINTFCGVVTKDPETGVSNVGMYRGMVVDENTISVNLLPGKHWGQHYAKYRKLGKPMPVAVFYGGDPILSFVAAAPHGNQVSEYDVAGGLRGAPVPLVKCETVDLEVPAGAEIVVEGFIPHDPESYRMEGPFGEFTGYYGGIAAKRPVIQVSCLMHRNDPILVGSPEGPPATEDHLMSSISMSAVAWDALERNGVPDVTDVFVPPIGSATDIRVQIRKQYQGHAKQVSALLWGINTTTFFKNVMVVEEDIDIHDYVSLEWAFAYRVNAKEDGIIIYPGTAATALDPSTNPEWNDPVRFGSGRWNRVLIDATREWRWGPREEWDGERFPPKVEPTAEIKSLVEKRWQEYGFTGKR